MEDEWKSWTVGRIEGAQQTDLEERLKQLMRVKKAVETEADFVQHILGKRKERK